VGEEQASHAGWACILLVERDAGENSFLAPESAFYAVQRKGGLVFLHSNVGFVFCLGLVEEAEAVVARSCLSKPNKFWRNNLLR